MPLFSVIIPTYNRYSLTRRAIDSVLSQSCDDFEVILIDDGSTDNSPQLKDDYSDLIRYIRQENKGVSSARNRGISLALGTYCAFLDSDDLWQQNKLQTHASYLKDNPHVMIHQCEEIWIRNGKRVNPWKKHIKRKGYIFRDSLELCLISPSSVVIHKDVFKKYGCFDEQLPACEDYDLWLRITPHEWIGLIDEKLNIRHGGHSDQLSSRFWGMDRFRVYSIIKLIITEGAALNSDDYDAAKRKALEKLQILRTGAVKRGRNDFADRMSTISEQLGHGDYNSINLLNLLQE